MSWTTPTLKQVRQIVRDDITASLTGAVVVGNSVLRVMADSMAALGHLTLRYLDWQARQYLPDTAEIEFLDRHGNIWLVNSDGTVGRKAATTSSGIVTFTGSIGFVVPQFTVLIGQSADGETRYETTAQVVIGSTATPCPVTAIDAGAAGNLPTGEPIVFETPIAGVDGTATVVTLTGGTNDETDDELRERILERIQNPPMGGDEDDYIQWAKAIAGVTRAWSYPNEMGIGTVTVRFMMDNLRADNHGIPNDIDVQAVIDYLNTVRPVTVKDFFVIAPEAFEVTVRIENLTTDDEATRAAIEANLLKMFSARSIPGQTMFRSWVDEAVSQATGEEEHDLVFTNAVMPDANHIPVLGSITYG